MQLRRAGARLAPATLMIVAAWAQPAAADGNAVAYLDPGTGSLVTQVLLGGAAGLAVAAKLGWRRLVGRTGGAAKETPIAVDDEVERQP